MYAFALQSSRRERETQMVALILSCYCMTVNVLCLFVTELDCGIFWSYSHGVIKILVKVTTGL